MESHQFLEALSTVLAVAALTTVLFQRLGQPVVLGYILAGLIVGPHLPIPLVANLDVVQTLSELGVILLMFSLGLEFSLRKLLKVGPTAGLTAVIETSLMLWLGYLAGQWLGWTTLESLFAGAALAISSTTIIIKAFEDHRVSGRRRDLVLGILLVEDLIAVLLMASLTAVAKSGSLNLDTLARTGGRLALFLTVMLLGGLWLVPRAMQAVVRLKRPETTLVASMGICFVCALAALEAGYSVALGAFLAGSLVAESGEEKVIEPLVQPVRDMFAAVFFVSVGMLLDPVVAFQHWGAVLLLTAAVVLGKVLSVSLGAFLTGNGVRASVQAGMSLAQIGEFSFIIAALGAGLGATGGFLYPVAVAVSAITTLLTPWLIRASGPAAEWVDRKMPGNLQTFTSLYGSWTDRLASSPDRAFLMARLRQLGKLLLLDALAIFLATIICVAYARETTAYVSRTLDMGPLAGRLAVLALALLATLPFFFGIFRVTRAMGLALAGPVFPPQKEGELDLSAAPRRAMVAALQVVITLLVGIPLLALTQPLLQGWVGGLVLALLLGVMAWGFWRHAEDLQGHVKAGAEMLADAFKERVASGQPGHGAPDLPGLLSGLGNPVTVTLPAGSPCLGRSLAELRLRGSTGATALALIDAEGKTLSPGASTRLAAGDTLVLAGTLGAQEAAQALLLGESSKP
jgi:CPA2 family monovalent cation:H+ antiporter-2